MFIYVDGIYRYVIDDVNDVPLKSKFIFIYRGSSSATLPEGKSWGLGCFCPALNITHNKYPEDPKAEECQRHLGKISGFWGLSGLASGAKMFKVWSTFQV